AAVDVGNAGATLPGPAAARLPAGVRQLDPYRRTLCLDERDDRRQRLRMAVRPEAEVLRRDAALGRDRRGLGEHQAGPADRPTAQVDQVPVGGQTVPGLARVLAHGRNDDPVAEAEPSQHQWLEEAGRHGVLFLVQLPWLRR